ncbi:MAG: hypothetical protein SGPRY_008379, partial [Prymnesium sp.]
PGQLRGGEGSARISLSSVVCTVAPAEEGCEQASVIAAQGEGEGEGGRGEGNVGTAAQRRVKLPGETGGGVSNGTSEERGACGSELRRVDPSDDTLLLGAEGWGGEGGEEEEGGGEGGCRPLAHPACHSVGLE